MNYFNFIPLTMLLGSGLLLTACGGSESTTETAKTTKVSFALADAPVDDVAEVWIAVDSIELVKEGQDNILIDVKDGEQKYAQVDLKKFQGGDSKTILEGIEVEVGEYQNLILHVLDESDGADYSYVKELDGDDVPMKQPSQKLKLGSFEVTSQGVQRFTIHFDLRTALVQNQNGQRYNLKPHGVTIVDNETVASLSGRVDPNLFDCVDDDNEGNFVYLYPGHGLLVLVDNYDESTDQTGLPEGAVSPLGSTKVVMNDDDTDYSYTFGFIPEGKYTVAFTCSGSNDDESTYDGIIIPNPTLQKHEVMLYSDVDSEQNFEEIFL
jgi:hypothetical protein